ncbi:MAG: class I SAM-dependent methyltransferase [Actinobacteria bacterium]|nr:class I SAM-dependent methyltransferase [Actinomycetota bacterium]
MAEATNLELTGERTLPGIPRENYWFTRHLVSYKVAREISVGKRVIDIGCGEGYGPALLAESAHDVLGVDIAEEVMHHARAGYTAPNLTFEVMDVSSLDVPGGSFDLAVSLQVIEHLADESGYLQEIARVLEPGGAALVTTPNRLTISPGSDTPINPFHIREYTPEEFGNELAHHFARVEISGVFHAGWLKLNERVKAVDFIEFYRMSRLNPRYWTHRLLTPLVRASAFRVGTTGLNRCLDILAVCTRPLRGGGGD